MYKDNSCSSTATTTGLVDRDSAESEESEDVGAGLTTTRETVLTATTATTSSAVDDKDDVDDSNSDDDCKGIVGGHHNDPNAKAEEEAEVDADASSIDSSISSSRSRISSTNEEAGEGGAAHPLRFPSSASTTSATSFVVVSAAANALEAAHNQGLIPTHSHVSGTGHAALVGGGRRHKHKHQHQLQSPHAGAAAAAAAAAAALSADVRLLRKIGYIASRVRGLARYYGDFRLVNPYSAHRQRRQLQEILLKHSIFDPGRERERALLLAAAAVAVGAAAAASTIEGESPSRSRSNSHSHSRSRSRSQSSSCSGSGDVSRGSSNASSTAKLDTSVEEDVEIGDDDAVTNVLVAATNTTTTATATTTVRRKSLGSSTTASVVSATTSTSTQRSPIRLLEELLIQFYEDQRSSQLTVIRRRRSNGIGLGLGYAHDICRNGTSNNNNDNNKNGHGHGRATESGNKNGKESNSNGESPITPLNFLMSSSSVERLSQPPPPSASCSGGNSDSSSSNNDNNIDRAVEGGASEPGTTDKTINYNNYNANTTSAAPTSAIAAQSPQAAATSSQQRSLSAFLQPDADNPRRRRASDCSPLHVGGHAAVHAAAALSNQLQMTLKNNNCATTTAAKFPFHRGSCGAAGEHLLAANSIANRATIILSKSCSNVDGGTASPTGIGLASVGGQLRASATDIKSNALADARDAVAVAAAAAASNNGNNEYSILQLNNTIIQCHFNDDDFRALVRDLKRKVEYTERMNWLCLSKRPLGPPHRKSSLPKHQEVKRRFLEICDTTFSDEVKAALRLPAFDSYEWSDADVIHLMQTMFIELGFIEKFNIPVDTLREWLYEVYKHYNEVPFHNFRHCFCVAQMMYAITRQANLLSRLGDLECLILLVSCICHDLDHPGYNNIYQINARTELALRYNDISPLENHHCSIAFRLLEHPECNIFKNFSRDTFNTIREGIIRCILATDMARHNEILTQFKEVTPIFDYSNRAHINLLCMILIKVADISNEARPMDVAEPWLDRLLQEFFAQSAAEKSEGLPVTPFMDPDKVSKPGSQVRFIGLVLLPLFEALGELVPELTELIIIPVRIALEYYRRLNDAQTKTRKSVADSNTSATSDSNSGTIDSNAATMNTGTGGEKIVSDRTSGTGAGGTDGSVAGGGASTGSLSPQMPRSGSGISVKSRRSIPSQKSASRTSVDEPGGMPAELHDLPEGSESGDSETATEVDVAEKTSKFKVDTEGSSNRSKSSHSTSRKSSREKRPSMIGEMCSSGGGQRIRNSYGNIHGYHSNRCHFGSNRAVSLDQYSTNNRRLSDGLPQVISDSNVFYGRHNRSSLEKADTTTAGARHQEDLNMNAMQQQQSPVQHMHQPLMQVLSHLEDRREGVGGDSNICVTLPPAVSVPAPIPEGDRSASNGNISPTQALEALQEASLTAASSSRAGSASSTSWKSRLRQFSDYFSFSFDKGNKRFGSTRSSPCTVRSSRNNNANGGGASGAGNMTDRPSDGLETKLQATCCTISNSMQSAGGASSTIAGAGKPNELLAQVGRHRAYSLDVPCSRSVARYSSSSGGGGDSSHKSSRHEGSGGDEDNSNNTLHSSSGAGSDLPGIRIGSAETSEAIVLPPVKPSLSIELGLASASASSSEAAPKI
ncbi:high affinity cGMP-specific 3',5'-cyclic phosphodiesterase 9A [Scaptodrosophila lebanonensis]|uniref:Phosphodiesterase n=1 Tax=Drosophila lebanonensis TaxID=7225 RepID=A0A6J2TZT3_DROLE|nr:high affinity cGMP-specific 3',5'-cyclic phosphodiesterase 9A [Scaptodrosophila lebanonensis]